MAPASVARKSDTSIAVPYELHRVSEDFQVDTALHIEAVVINKLLADHVKKMNDFAIENIRGAMIDSLHDMHETFSRNISTRGGVVDAERDIMMRGAPQRLRRGEERRALGETLAIIVLRAQNFTSRTKGETLTARAKAAKPYSTEGETLTARAEAAEVDSTEEEKSSEVAPPLETASVPLP